MSLIKQLEEYLGKGRIKKDVVLAPYTTFKVGGPAEYYFVAESDKDIIASTKAAHELNIPYYLFGGISNVVIGPDGLKGLVVKNLNIYKKVLEDTADYVILRVSSGYSMTRLAKETAEFGYEGLEYHLGLPGSVGGAIAMNSGWYAHKPDKYVGDPLVRALLVRADGSTFEADHDYFQFKYDYSTLRDSHESLVWADFKLKKSPPAELIRHGQDALAHRKKTQPYGVATSGCYFQNVDGVSAGKIIDEAGLKNFSIGGAQVSPLHANFIINTGTATAEDVQKLVEHVRKVVKEKKGIELHDEVICL